MSADSTQLYSSLEQAMAAMTFEVLPGRFALCGFDALPDLHDLELLGDGPGQITREGGETSLLIEQSGLSVFVQRHPRARIEGDLVWIRFRAPMAWELVGFLAKVTGALAAAGVPLGAVCGFSRDHLFLHEKFLETSLSVLRTLFPAASGD